MPINFRLLQSNIKDFRTSCALTECLKGMDRVTLLVQQNSEIFV